MHSFGSSPGFCGDKPGPVANRQRPRLISPYRASTMAASPERWRFWDFGSQQILQDTLGGELVRVHGAGAVFADGPFKFAVDDDLRPVVVGLEGDDESCALHFVDEAMATIVTVAGAVGANTEQSGPILRCGDKPARSLSDLRAKKHFSRWSSRLKAKSLSRPNSQGWRRLRGSETAQCSCGCKCHGSSNISTENRGSGANIARWRLSDTN